MCGIGFMEHSMVNNLDKQYQHLLQDILEYGVDKQDRTGTGTKSIFGYTIHHNMMNGFPLLTTKKVPFKTMATELMWFLMGDTNIKYLVDNDCHIWDGDAYKNYSKQIIANNLHLLPASDLPSTQEEFINKIKTDDEFAKKWGELGKIYGKQWRSWDKWEFVEGENEFTIGLWKKEQIDQIQNLINDLKTNPDSRRLMVNAWNVGELDEMVLPPCHYGFQVYTRELSREERIENYNSKFENKIEVPFIKLNLGDAIENTIDMTLSQVNIPTRAISLMWNQRSVDVFLGLPFNIASYGLLLEMIAREVNMVPEHLIGHLGDTHLYSNHIEQAKEQLSRTPKKLPILKMSSGHNFRAALNGKVDEIDLNDFILLGYDPHPTIKAPLSN
jgi:thymidylate synthase